MEKAFGKLSIEQFRELVKALPEVRADMREFSELVRTAPRERLRGIFKEDFSWSFLYELPFLDSMPFMRTRPTSSGFDSRTTLPKGWRSRHVSSTQS